MNEDIKKVIKEEIDKVTSFSYKKIGDTPTDAFQLTPKKYVDLNGSVANRPRSSVASIGQRYFATDTNIPMTFTGNNWVNGVGSVVALAS